MDYYCEVFFLTEIFSHTNTHLSMHGSVDWLMTHWNSTSRIYCCYVNGTTTTKQQRSTVMPHSRWETHWQVRNDTHPFQSQNPSVVIIFLTVGSVTQNFVNLRGNVRCNLWKHLKKEVILNNFNNYRINESYFFIADENEYLKINLKGRGGTVV